jgi:hypothetical protein
LQVNGCIMHRINQGKSCIFMKYLNDLPIVATKRRKIFKAKLRARFGEITVDEGRELSYLGIQIKCDKDKTIINMSLFVQQMLKVLQSQEKKTFLICR